MILFIHFEFWDGMQNPGPNVWEVVFPNISIEGGVKQLKADKDCMVLIRDKGVALVVMDRSNYIRKAKELLDDTNTYRTIQSDPTYKLKNKLINILKTIKVVTGLQENIYRRMYPTGASSPKFYGLPKIHKKNVPLRPVVSSIGSVTNGVAKELAKTIEPLVGTSKHHVSNTKEFADEIKKTKLEEEECITSYDVTALITSVPVPSALEIIKNKLEQDTDPPNRSNMRAENITELLGFCLNNTYFLFQEVFDGQTKGAAMGSPVSPIVANIYMVAFENRAISTALHHPRMWRNVDDTFVIQHQSHKEFLRHINTLDPSIKFTVEKPKDDGSIPFLDTIITPETDGTFTIGIYRKPTHTDLYLPCDRNHNLASKYSVVNTLTHRSHTICSTPKLLENELKHLEQVPGQCKYPNGLSRRFPINIKDRRRNRPLQRNIPPKMPHCDSVYTGHM